MSDQAQPAPPEDPKSHNDDILRRADALVFVDDLDEPVLSREDEHHLRDVLRLKTDALVVASNGAGTYRTCRFAPPAKLDASLKRKEKVAARAPSRLIIDGPVVQAQRYEALAVAFALLKGERNDWIVQKLTELGIDRITPIIAERCVVRLDPEGLRRRTERFRRIAREASAQARRPHLPEVDDPVTFAEATMAASFGVSGATVLAEPGGARLSLEVRTVFIGPEGGWSDRELACQLPRLGLGPTVLRAETAAIAAASRLSASRV